MKLDFDRDGFYVIKPDGTDPVWEDRSKEVQFSELYGIINCSTIQLLETRTGQQFLMDEDGKMRGDATPNYAATDIAGHLGLGLSPFDIMVGTIVIACGKARCT